MSSNRCILTCNAYQRGTLIRGWRIFLPKHEIVRHLLAQTFFVHGSKYHKTKAGDPITLCNLFRLAIIQLNIQPLPDIDLSNGKTNFEFKVKKSRCSRIQQKLKYGANNSKQSDKYVLKTHTY